MQSWFTILFCGFTYSWSTIQLEVDAIESCLEHCSYNAYAKDAECTNRGLSAIPIPCPSAHTLDISSNSLVSLEPSSFRGYYQLRYLHLENNLIESISPGAFNAVKRKLQLVNISNNYLSTIQTNTFVNMTLWYLLLSHNQISQILPGAFRGMNQLKKIYLGDNHLTVLDYSIFRQMPKLQEVNLRNNFITSFDVSFIRNHDFLRKIFIQNNSITEITGRVEKVQTKIILINLSGNRLHSFNCSVMDNLVGLNDLYLANNSLEGFNGCGRHHYPILKISNNPFHCDCTLTTLIIWLEQNPDAPSPNCSSPESLRGTPVRNVQLDCADDEDISSTASSPAYYWIRHYTTRGRQIISQSLSSRRQPDVDASLEWSIVPSSNDSLVIQPTKGDSRTDISFNRNLLIYQTPAPGYPYGIPTTLFFILIAIVVLTVVVLVLLVFCLKHYCVRSSDDEDKKKYPTENIETGEDPTAHLTKDHNYESIKDIPPRTTPRQYSTETDGSNVTMVRTMHDSKSGLYNPGVGDMHDHCVCQCHEGTSDASGSWVDVEGSCSDLSYEMDNHFNEISECLPHQSNCCGINRDGRVQENELLLTSSLSIGYPPPAYEVSFNHPSPPPLPPKATNEIYIQHHQLRCCIEENNA